MDFELYGNNNCRGSCELCRVWGGGGGVSVWYITLEGVPGLCGMWEAFLCGIWKACLCGLWEAFLCGRVCVGFTCRNKLCVVTWEVCMSAVCGVGYYIGNEHSSPERGGLDPSSLRGQTLPPIVWTDVPPRCEEALF